MKKSIIFLSFSLTVIVLSCVLKQEGKHLFILSGQSNMEGLKLEESFIPAINERFGTENVIAVKYAKGSQPIRRWYRDWKPLEESEPIAEPYLYDSLMIKVKSAIEKDERVPVILDQVKNADVHSIKANGEQLEDYYGSFSNKKESKIILKIKR